MRLGGLDVLKSNGMAEVICLASRTTWFWCVPLPAVVSASGRVPFPPLGSRQVQDQRLDTDSNRDGTICPLHLVKYSNMVQGFGEKSLSLTLNESAKLLKSFD